VAAGKRAERKVNEVLGDWRASVAQMASTQVGHATAAAPLVKRSKGTPQFARLQLYSGHIRGTVSIAFPKLFVSRPGRRRLCNRRAPSFQSDPFDALASHYSEC